ncbi:MAG: CPBP family intramembrane glutamic endopeptidase [Candidatus Dormibacteria bacterium]
MAVEPVSRRWLRRPSSPTVGRGSGRLEFLLILAGAAVVLLLPRVFGDPQGFDPDSWRLTAYFAVVTGAALAVRSLRAVAPLAFAFLTLAFPFSVWLWLLGYVGPAPSLIGAPNGLARNAFAGIVEMVLALVMAGCFHYLTPKPRPNLRLWVRPTLLMVVVGVGGTLLFLAIGFALPAPLLGREGVPLYALGGSAAVALGVANATSAIAQEIQFRGVLMSALERQQSPLAAVITQGVVFGLAHIAIQYEGPATSFIPIVIALGWLWGWMTVRTRSLLPAMLVHIVADFFVLAVVVSGLYGG